MTRTSYYLSFRIHQWSFALPVNRISAILEEPEYIERKSNMDYMAGIHLTENGVIPIIDPTRVLGLKNHYLQSGQQVVLCNFYVANYLFKIGWRVDELFSVIDIESEMMDCNCMNSALPFNSMTAGRILSQDPAVYLIDLGKVFTEDGLLDVYNDMRKSLGMEVG